MIYFLEDDPGIQKLVIYTLNSQGLKAEGFDAPSLFWRAMEENKPSLILLDIMLPEEDGISVLKKLKASSKTESIPVILITAKSTEYDTVMGLDAGADDYIAKPFGMMELLARIRTAMRRNNMVLDVDKPKTYSLGALFVDPTQHIVRCGNEDIVLTLKEFQVLCILLERTGSVLTRDALLNSIWGYSFDGASRTVDVHIRTLRQKLGSCGDYIETVRGIGYKISGK